METIFQHELMKLVEYEEDRDEWTTMMTSRLNP